MWLLRILLFVALLVALVIVGLGNSAGIDLNLFGHHMTDVPLYLALFGAAIVGLVLGLGFAAVREIQWRVVLSRERRGQATMERELHELRTAPLEEPASGSGDPRRPGS
jgi:uncharacterized integral membrane protein